MLPGDDSDVSPVARLPLPPGDVRAEEPDIARLFEELERELVHPPDERTRWIHLSAMASSAGVRPPSSRPRRRRAPKIAATMGACALVVGLTGGLAAAGSLPQPLQRVGAGIARTIGIHVDDPGPVGGRTKPETPAPRGKTSNPGTGNPDTRNPSDTMPPSPDAAPPSVPGPVANGGAAGHSGEAPGHTDAPPPGSSDAAPGNTASDPPETAPGNSGNPPSHLGTPPGQPGTPPGAPTPPQSATPPGKSADAPGHTGTAPGRSGSTPGAGDPQPVTP
jgi:hypothetical protein